MKVSFYFEVNLNKVVVIFLSAMSCLVEIPYIERIIFIEFQCHCFVRSEVYSGNSSKPSNNHIFIRLLFYVFSFESDSFSLVLSHDYWP